MSEQQATPNDAYLLIMIIMLAAQAKPFSVAATVSTRLNRGLQVLGCRGLQLGRGASASGNAATSRQGTMETLTAWELMPRGVTSNVMLEVHLPRKI